MVFQLILLLGKRYMRRKKRAFIDADNFKTFCYQDGYAEDEVFSDSSFLNKKIDRFKNNFTLSEN